MLKMIKMKMKLLLIPRIVICAVLAMVVMSNCDTLEEDALDPVTPIEGASDQAVLAGQTSVIDLKSKLTVTVPVKTEIVKEPSFGTLSNLGEGIYEYEPNEGVLGEQDVIDYRVSDLNDNVLSTNSIFLNIVEDFGDSCLFVAVADIINYDLSTMDNTVFNLDVLSNDYVCDSLLPVELTVVRQPSFGSAQVQQGEIIYELSEQQPQDKLVYQISSGASDNLVSLATVTLNFLSDTDTCMLQLRNDHFNYTSITRGQKFDVLANDVVCDTDSLGVSIVVGPTIGTAFIDDNNLLDYTLFDTFPAGQDSDSITYQVCADGQCEQAVVWFSLFPQQFCDSVLTAVDDRYILPDSTMESFNVSLDVLSNDTLCGNYVLDISMPPSIGEASIDGDYISYLSKESGIDSLSYSLCDPETSWCDIGKVVIER